MVVRVLFIHGVANRREDDPQGFDNNVKRRDEFFRTMVFGANAVMASPYWGDLGGKGLWGYLCVPEGDMQAFGGGVALAAGDLDGGGPDAPPVVIANPGEDDAVLLRIARENGLEGQEAVVDLIALSMPAALDSDAAKNSALAARMHAFAKTPWTWLPALDTDEEFRVKLEVEFDNFIFDDLKLEQMGFFGDIGKAFDKLKGAVLNAASNELLRKVKGGITRGATMFLGDVFTYLNNGNAIRSRILEDLNKLWSEKDPEDKLVIVCHSFGGPILMDILSEPSPDLPADLKIDAVVTVGSQVAFFQEMDLYKKRVGDHGITPPGEKVPKPAMVGVWLNVLDFADPLAFRMEQIIDGVEDFCFNTQTSLVDSHNTYFIRPSFYDRLKVRLEAMGVI